MRMVLKNNTRVNILKSDLHAIVDMSEKALPSSLSGADDLARNMEIKCKPPFCNLLSWGVQCIFGAGMASTDIRIS